MGAWLAGSVKVIHTLHGIHYLNYSNPVLRTMLISLERMLSKKSSAVICVSRTDRDRGLENRLFNPETVHVIRNGVAAAGKERIDSDDLRRELSIGPECPVIINVARLHRQKAQHTLIKAFARVIEKIPEARLMFVGDGPLRSSLEKQTAELNLSQQVRFLGMKRQIQDYLAISDLFVLSSLWEGLPLSLLEAMSVGKPAVCTESDGISEIITSGDDGILVPVEDSESMSEAIVYLLTNTAEAEKMGQRAKVKIQKQFDVHRMISETRALYTELRGQI
ncbi:hypothetical protein BVY01_01490 [bacterium I07]|nr:hypothetical protein BVY01_01490 [bacterium I07]